jgi:hypothetical protein
MQLISKMQASSPASNCMYSIIIYLILLVLGYINIYLIVLLSTLWWLQKVAKEFFSINWNQGASLPQ